MYRYYVFAISEYYPAGGLDDCEFKTNDLKEAIEKVKTIELGDWIYVFDFINDEIVFEL